MYAVGEAASGLHGANRLGGNSLIELLVYGKIVGRAAAAYSARLTAHNRCLAAVSRAREEVDAMLTIRGTQPVRYLQRAVRNTMSEHAGVVRTEAGLRAGLRAVADIECQMSDLAVHPDISGFADLAHAFDLQSGLVAARATLKTALERRETRGAHIRADQPQPDQSLQVNLVWAGPGRIEHETLPGIPHEIATLMRPVSTLGKLVE